MRKYSITNGSDVLNNRLYGITGGKRNDSNRSNLIVQFPGFALISILCLHLTRMICINQYHDNLMFFLPLIATAGEFPISHLIAFCSDQGLQI